MLVPGDLHLWGKAGGNRSDLFVQLLQQLPFQYLVTNGDLFEGRSSKRETIHDAEVLSYIRSLDNEGRWVAVRGNHDRRLFVGPKTRSSHTLRRVTNEQQDVTWLHRPRVTENTLLSVVDGDTFFGPAHAQAHEHIEKHEGHPGSHDLVVLSVAGKNFLFEHGDAHDRFVGKLAAKDDLVTMLASTAYDMIVSLEKTHSKVGAVSGVIKQQFTVWRGVCKSVAVGVTKRAQTLGVEVHGTVGGHTHYPLYTVIHGIPHANVGSFRGHTPSFAIITTDGELLPPFVIKSESPKKAASKV